MAHLAAVPTPGSDETMFALRNMRDFFERFLGYDAPGMLVGRDALPKEISFYAPESRQEIRPSFATGTTGSEGTLGGLVEEGRRLRHHLRETWDIGRLCSNDPACAAHDPAATSSDRRTEGAACHGCVYIAECSCEKFNRYLDRALVVPTIGNLIELAFFSVRPDRS